MRKESELWVFCSFKLNTEVNAATVNLHYDQLTVYEQQRGGLAAFLVLNILQHSAKDEQEIAIYQT